MKIAERQLRKIIREEATKLLGRKMKVTKKQLRKIIKEQISATPTSQVEVEWDFFLDDDDAWNALSYEEQEAEAGIPPVVNIPPDVMAEYHAGAKEYGASQAEDIITDYLSEMHGWLHQGWSWV